jgi:hypothetical protein
VPRSLQHDNATAAAPRTSRVRPFLSAVAAPALVAILNVLLGPPIYMLLFSLAVKLYPMLPGSSFVAVMTGVRGALMVWAGQRVVARGVGGRGMAAVAGLLVFALDHLVLKGGMFLLMRCLGRGDHELLLAFGGVVLSFVMFAPLPALLGLLGGFTAGLGDRVPRRTGSPSRRPDIPTSARVLAWLLIVVGALNALLGGFRLLFYGLLPLLRADRAMREEIEGHVIAFVIWVALAFVTLAGGIGLRGRRPSARPWILAGSVGTLVGFGWAARTPDGLLSVWTQFLFAPIFSAPNLLSTIVTPLVAALAVLLLTVRGRDWLETSPRAHWVAAFMAVVLLKGTLFYLAWREDPERRHASYAREVEALAVEPGKGRLVIVPTFDGAPLEGISEVAAKVTLDEQKTKQRRYVPARYANGVIEVADVDTGIYGLSIGIDANPANGTGSGWGLPGDLISWGAGRWDLLHDGQIVRQEVAMHRVMRLLEPEDTGPSLGRTRAAVPAFRSPVTIAWEAVPGARLYGYGISRVSADGERWVDGTQGRNTTWTLELPPSKPGETYVLDLRAYGRTRQIGIFEVQGIDWRGWDYRFRVAE